MKKGVNKKLSLKSLVLAVMAVACFTVVALVLAQNPFGNAPTSSSGPQAGQTPAYNGVNARATLAARRDTAPVAARPVNTPVPPATTEAPPATPTRSAEEERRLGLVRQLDEAWQSYKREFIQLDGRVIDPIGGVTTSEGQSYAMLRSVWKDDRKTFDLVLLWARNNLQTGRADKMFAYKWGKAADGSWKILDNANATDAEIDLSMALIFAARRWKEPDYEKQALEILNSVWERTIVSVRGKPYLTAGEWAPSQNRPTLNPSYLAPYAFRLFAAVDSGHNWAGLVDTAYEVIRGCSELEVGGATPARLPANWCAIDKINGNFTVAQDYPRLTVSYGYDAFRTMWRVALDYKWFGEKRALDYLRWSDTLRNKWKQDGRLVVEYASDGKVGEDREDTGVYAGNLANFVFTDPALAAEIVARKIGPAYFKDVYKNINPPREVAGWEDVRNYYTQNWVWFGLALYTDTLPNLATDLKQVAGNK